MSGQIGKAYVPKTEKGKEMARMLVSFCCLSKSSANTIVVYFGVSTMDTLADFCEEHWKDTFIQWQKHHTCPDGLERVLVLSQPQQDRIRCVAWACRYHRQIIWPPGAFLQPGDPKPYPMIYFLKKEHFELMHAQMEHEEQGKISLKSMSELTDVPTYKSTTSMSTHICDFKSYLSTHYGVEGFPLDYVM